MECQVGKEKEHYILTLLFFIFQSRFQSCQSESRHLGCQKVLFIKRTDRNSFHGSWRGNLILETFRPTYSVQWRSIEMAHPLASTIIHQQILYICDTAAHHLHWMVTLKWLDQQHVLLQQDNAHFYIVKLTKSAVQELGLEVLLHPAYSLDANSLRLWPLPVALWQSEG